jgi:hypothetical protein
MRIMIRLIASIALALGLAAGTAWAQDISTIGGNPVVERSFTDSTGNSFVMDTNHPFTAGGRLTHWEIYADNTYTVQLVIYRQKGGSFIEVGRSGVVTPVVGYNLFKLRDKEIRVQAGDFVGAYYPEAGGGPISFSVDDYATLDTIGPTAEPDLARTAVFAFSTSDSTAFAWSQDRHYSLRAFGKDED